MNALKKNTKKTTKKKGQITLFVIVGLVAVLVVALAFFLYREVYLQKPVVPEQVVSDEVKPLQAYITQCVYQISKEGLEQIGRTGGYMTTAGLKVNPIPYKSEALMFEPDILPYWVYVEACPQYSAGCLKTAKPPLCQASKSCVIPDSVGPKSIQESLNSYVEQHLQDCVRNFEPFASEFSVKPVAGTEIVADTVIGQDNIQVTIDYPVEVTNLAKGRTETLGKFTTTLPVKFKQIYSFASEISDLELQHNFLEHTTLNLISVYSGIDENLLPPMGGVQAFIAGKKFWILQEQKDKIQYDVLPYMNLMQFMNAKNYAPIYMKSQDVKPELLRFAGSFYNNFAVKTSNNSYDLDASMTYPYSDIYLRIGDGSQVIQPTDMGAGDSFPLKIIGFFMNDYNFKYDLTYPVIVSLKDPDAFNGEGYTFKFALQANIRKNGVFNQSLVELNGAGIRDIDLNQDPFRLNKSVTVQVYDKHTQVPLSNAIVSYDCGQRFTIGVTSYAVDRSTGLGTSKLASKFPYCVSGGRIIVEKNGYVSDIVEFNNNDETDLAPETFSVSLWPLKKINVSIYKRTSQDVEDIMNSGAGAIDLYDKLVTWPEENETAFVTIQRTPDYADQEPVPLVGFAFFTNNTKTLNQQVTQFSQDKRTEIEDYYAKGYINESTRNELLASLNGINNIAQQNQAQPIITTQDSLAKPRMQEIEFAPGNYTTEGTLITNTPFIIPAKTDYVCAGVDLGFMGCVGEKKPIEYPAQTFNAWVSGGMKRTFTLTEDQVYGANSITFYLLEQPIPKTWDDFNNYKSIEDYQKDKKYLIKPAFS